MEIQRGGFHLRRFVIGDLAGVLGLVHMTVDRSYAGTYWPEARAACKGYASADRIAADAGSRRRTAPADGGERPASTVAPEPTSENEPGQATPSWPPLCRTGAEGPSVPEEGRWEQRVASRHRKQPAPLELGWGVALWSWRCIIDENTTPTTPSRAGGVGERTDVRLAVRFRAWQQEDLRCLLNGSQYWSSSSPPVSPRPQPWSPGSVGSMTGSTRALPKQLGNAPRSVNAWRTSKGRWTCYVLTLRLDSVTKASPDATNGIRRRVSIDLRLPHPCLRVVRPGALPVRASLLHAQHGHAKAVHAR